MLRWLWYVRFDRVRFVFFSVRNLSQSAKFVKWSYSRKMLCFELLFVNSVQLESITQKKTLIIEACGRRSIVQNAQLTCALLNRCFYATCAILFFWADKFLRQNDIGLHHQIETINHLNSCTYITLSLLFETQISLTQNSCYCWLAADAAAATNKFR